MPSGSEEPRAVVVLVTVPTAPEGQAMARSLVELRLAACVNVLPGVTSIYRWEGKVEESAEVLLIVKTIPAQLPELEKAIRAGHPYDVPEILTLPVHSGSEDYLRWLLSSVG